MQMKCFVQDRVHRRIGARIQRAALQPRLAPAPVGAGDFHPGIGVAQVQAEFGQQPRDIAAVGVGEAQHECESR
jgi:hypothetical protein